MPEEQYPMTSASRLNWSGIGRSRPPLFEGCPGFGGEVNEIDGRIFNLGVGVRIRQMFGQTTLEFGVGFRRGRVLAQEVTEENCVSLIGAARLANVRIGATLPGWRSK